MTDREFPGIEKCLELVLSDDPMAFEDGYHLLLPRVGDFVDQISEALFAQKNSAAQAKLIELLGECEDENLVPVLARYLDSHSRDVISWTLTALERTDNGRTVAAKFRHENPEWTD